MSSTKWQQTQQRFSDSIKRGKKQLGYLSKEIAAHPGDGFLWWLKNHQQNPDLEQAVEDLRARSEQKDFTFQEVFDCLNVFTLREDDYAHAEWYAQAHTKIMALNKRLDSGDLLVQGIFRGVITELKYITEADDFHKRWGLIPLQQKVTKMYEQLLANIDDLKKVSKQQQLLKTKQLTLEEKKLDLEKIRTQKEALQIQKEKAELLKEKVIQEKLYREAKHKEHLEAQNLMQMQDKKQQHEAEVRRREDLQASYADLAEKWDKQVSTDTSDNSGK